MVWKLCSKCLTTKPYNAFCFDKRSVDGHGGHCKECVNTYYRNRFVYKGRRKKDVSHLLLLTDVDKSYMAGLFDGEGCIIIAEEKPKPRGINPTYRLQISLANKNKSVLNWCKDKFGGRLGKTNSVDCGNWIASSMEAGSILEVIMSFMKIKKGRAEIIINEFMKLGVGADYLSEKKRIKSVISNINRNSGN